MFIQISMAKSQVDYTLRDTKTQFTTADKFPRELEKDLKKGYVIMVGMRPLLGTNSCTGDSLYGRHWVSMDHESPEFEDWLLENEQLQARAVMVLTKAEIAGIALVDNHYADKYMEEPLEERFELLEPIIDNLYGKTWRELKELLKEANRKGLVKNR